MIFLIDVIVVADRGQTFGLEGYFPLRTGGGSLFAWFTAAGGNQQRVEDLILHGHILRSEAEVLE